RKKAAKEAELLAKRAEREADLEARRERKERDAANRKRERDDEMEARRLERDAEAAAAAAAKARAELDKRLQQRYPIEDRLLAHEPPRDPPLPPAPTPRDPGADVFRGVPPDVVGDLLAVHALLRAVFAAASSSDATTTSESDEEAGGEMAVPSLEAFAAALVAPMPALAGRRGALRPIRAAHACLLRALLNDASAE
ncbi:MAG: hypothetical protein AAFU70_14755, partial [Planctomycetota bacterium]